MATFIKYTKLTTTSPTATSDGITAFVNIDNIDDIEANDIGGSRLQLRGQGNFRLAKEPPSYFIEAAEKANAPAVLVAETDDKGNPALPETTDEVNAKALEDAKALERAKAKEAKEREKEQAAEATKNKDDKTTPPTGGPTPPGAGNNGQGSPQQPAA